MLVVQTLGVRNSKGEWNFKVNGKSSGVARSDDSIGRATEVLNIWRELVIDLACEKIATVSTTVKENQVQSNVTVTVSRIEYGASFLRRKELRYEIELMRREVLE